MKRLLIGLMATLAMSSAQASTMDFNAYMRAATGTNNHGGAMECYNNKGAAAGNEFRLGNECGIYGEFLFGTYLLKGAKEETPFWRLASNFAFVYKNSTDFETTNGDNQTGGNPNNWVLRELYTEAGYVDGLPFTVWAGKRFYRWGDMHMDDFFSIDMSGPGAGIGGLKSNLGLWSVAVIQNSESTEFPGRDQTVATKNGRGSKSTLHIRLEEVSSPLGAWSVWLAGGATPSTTSSDGTTNYKSQSGGMIAVKNTAKFGPGENDFGVGFGQSVMSNLVSRGDLVRDCDNNNDANCTVAKSNRVRVWEGYTFDRGNWSTQIAFIYDDFNSGTDTASHVRWTSLGVRPIYWFTDHLSMVFEGGISNVVDDGGIETATGSGVFEGQGTRNLVRTTIGPQISLGKGFNSRPVIRAFYTYNSWNDNNKVSFKNTSAANDTSAHTVGVQTELWF